MILAALGNRFRSDDAVGPLALDALQTRFSNNNDGIRFVEVTGVGTGLFKLP